MNVVKSMVAVTALVVVLATAEGSVPTAEPSGVLDGIDEVYVRVEYVSEIVTDTGLEENDLLIELANRIRDAGLLVLSARPDEANGPLVVLALESVELPTGDVALHASLELREVVVLARLPGVAALGSTWYSSILTVSPRSHLVDESRAVVAALAEEFVTDLAAATP